MAVKPLALLLATLGCVHAAPPLPGQLPTGAQVVAGNAAITSAGTVMTVTQGTQRAAIDWASFNVGSAAAVHFNQLQGAGSVTLNRVLDTNPSQIYGRITAPGQVFFTNPNGMYFAPGASVDVGGLVATTHRIGNDDFMAGRYLFERNGATGSIINEGELKAALGGYIALLAPEVRNRGVILAQLGTVALAAGEAYELQIQGQNTLANVIVEPATLNALVDNGHAVLAEGGLIILSARAANQLQGGIVRNSGSLVASSLVEKGGRILLTGDDITLTSTSRIDASGATGGGQVLVGGDWQGSGTLYQATRVSMESGARIDASATQQGDGGKVVLWSAVSNPDSLTSVHGEILAEGGSAGGDGGKIETSGHSVRLDGLRVSTRAVYGQTGQWLIDPYDITIAATNSNTGNSGGTFTASADSSSIDVATLLAALSGSAVTVSTAGAGTNQTGNITVDSAISDSSTNKLTLNATNGIVLNAGITRSSSGALDLIAGSGGLTGNGNLSLGGGVLTISQGGNSTYSGVVSGSGTSLVKTGSGALTLAGNNSYTGNTTVSAGTLEIGGASTLNGSSATTVATGAVLNWTSSANQNFNGNTTNGNVPLSYALLGGGTVNLGGSGNVSFLGTQGFTGVLNIAQSVLVNGATSGGLSSLKLGLGSATAININNGGTLTAGLAGVANDNSLVGASGTAADHAAITVNQGGTLIGVGDSKTLYNFTLNGGTLTTGTVSANGLNWGIFAFASGITVSADSVINGNLRQIGNVNIDVAAGKTLTYSGSLNDASGGAAHLTKSGSGSLLLSGANTYTSGTTINAGTLMLGSANAIGTTGTLTFGGGTLQYSASNVTDYSSRFSTAAGQAFNIDTNGQNVSYASGLTSSGGTLNKFGTGMLTLSGPSSYTGATDISAGILKVSNASALGSTAGGTTVASGATLWLDGVTVAENISIAGTGSAAAGALVASNTAGTSGTLTVADNASIRGDQGGTDVLNLGAISLAAGKSLNLGGGETLNVTTGAISAADTATALTINTLGTLNLGAVGTTGNRIGAVSIDSGVSTLNGIASASTIAASSSGDMTVAGNMSTTDTSASAIVLNAGKNAAAGTASGGNLIMVSATVSTGTGGRATLYSGALADTSLATLVGSGSGHFRYNSDETASNVTASLGSGLFAIYREQPVLSVAPGATAMTYGGSLPLLLASYSGYINGDTTTDVVSGTATWTVGGGLSGAGHPVAGAHDLAYASGLASSLGYALSNNAASTNELTVNKAPLSVTANAANKVYDGVAYAGGNGVVYAGFASGEDSTALGGVLGYAGASQGAVDAGNYPISPQGLTAQNYQISFVDGSLSISPTVPAPLTPPAAPSASATAPDPVSGRSQASVSLQQTMLADAASTSVPSATAESATTAAPATEGKSADAASGDGTAAEASKEADSADEKKDDAKSDSPATTKKAKVLAGIMVRPPVVSGFKRAYIVLLENADGTTGKIIISGAKGEQVVESAGFGVPLDGSALPQKVGSELMKQDFSSARKAQPKSTGR
jgi:filamentous hemagglutinin family protein